MNILCTFHTYPYLAMRKVSHISVSGNGESFTHIWQWGKFHTYPYLAMGKVSHISGNGESFTHIRIWQWGKFHTYLAMRKVSHISVSGNGESFTHIWQWGKFHTYPYLAMGKVLHISGNEESFTHIRIWQWGKWINPGKGVAPSSTPRCSSYWKGNLLVALDNSRQLYLIIKQVLNIKYHKEKHWRTVNSNPSLEF